MEWVKILRMIRILLTRFRNEKKSLYMIEQYTGISFAEESVGYFI